MFNETRTYHVIKNAIGQFFSIVDGHAYFTGVKQHAYTFDSELHANHFIARATAIDSTSRVTTHEFKF